MPTIRPDKELLQAEAAITFAQQVRAAHRKRTAKTDLSRVADIALAAEKIKAAMKPLKSLQGSFPYGPQTTIAEANRREIKEASKALQAERRKLWKMSPRKDQDA